MADADTQRVPGAPAIVAASLSKIDKCSVFVADVTLTHVRDSDRARKAPNPNVLLELGYALRTLGVDRILLVQNTAYGRPEELPFDLRGNRVVPFDLPAAGNPSDVREQLQPVFVTRLYEIVTSVGPPTHVRPQLQVDLSYRAAQITSEVHEYQLKPTILNPTDTIISDWSVELELPRALWPSNHMSSFIVEGRSNRDVVFLRMHQNQHSGPLYPGDSREALPIRYRFDMALFLRGDEILSLPVTFSAYVGPTRVAQVTKQVRDLQHF